ncbi:Protein of unknown function [Devosia limi DSM 17137]|jgi:hypothetical protein|uniref:DUF2442 domain-containing protein n=2 Tax=Devosia limi DSM 17137 TaxID=1121477 RepID=A0A1M4Y5B0_9HYPH|nr:Protein of unknown function [Devosia limi DSM 17137]
MGGVPIDMPSVRLKVTSIRAIVPFKLVLTFSDGSGGTFDAAPMIGERGEGTEALRDRAYFGKVELANGVPTWPNYFHVSPDWLREEMEKRGELQLPLPVRRRR